MMDLKDFAEQAFQIDKVDIEAENLLEISQEGVKASKENNQKGYFPYVPFSSGGVYFYELFTELYAKYIHGVSWMGRDKIKTPTFLDVGAGTGRIVKLAKTFGFNARGIEYQQEYVNVGRKMHNLGPDELICMDAFDLTTETLKDVDIIYTYMPIGQSNLMTNLHLWLVKESMNDTLFVEMLPSYYPVVMFPKTGSHCIFQRPYTLEPHNKRDDEKR